MFLYTIVREKCKGQRLYRYIDPENDKDVHQNLLNNII